MAFNTTGSLYLGNGSTVNEYNSTTWSQIGSTVTSGLSSSTDLASCNSPATLTLQKNVINGRVNAADQFTLSVKSGSTVSGTATTTGSATGIQDIQVGPLPVIQSNTYTLTEAMASGSVSSMADYSSTLSCVDENGTTLTVTSSQVTIPNRSGASVVCTFTNTPLVVPVTLSKTVQDAFGLNPAPGNGWTLGMSATRASGGGTVSQTTSATTQTTGTSGQVGWTVKFSNSSTTANLAVSETQQSTYTLAAAQCVVTHADGSHDTTTLSSTAGTVSGVRPGDSVACGFTNRLKPTYLTLKKVVVGGSASASAWTLTATGPTSGVAGVTGATAVTSRQVSAGSYTLTESGAPTGYDWTGLVCSDATSGTISGVSVTSNTLALTPGQDVTCTYTNTATAMTVQVTKVWTIKDSAGHVVGTYHVPAQAGDTAATLPAGFSANPTLTPAPTPAVSPLQWGTAYAGYTVGQSVTVGESDPVVPAGCALTGKQMTSVNGTALTPAVALGSGYLVTLTTTPKPNTFEITNTVTCPQQLTLVKKVAYGDVAPTTWKLTSAAPTGALPGSTAATTGTPAATAAVSANAAYALSESGGPATYVPTSAGWACTDDRTSGAVPVTSSAVTLGLGQSVTCTITNTTATLTLQKKVTSGSGVPADWTIVGTPGVNDYGFPTLSAPGDDTAQITSGTGQNTWEVRPDQAYGLSETVPTGSTRAYQLDKLEVSTDGGTTWATVSDVSAISVPAGQHWIYRFVNKPAPSFTLPLTGGMSTDAFLIGGGLTTLLALGGAAWNTRRNRRTA
jgi:hypothetical protein